MKTKEELLQLLLDRSLDEFNNCISSSDTIVDLTEIDLRGRDLLGVNFSKVDLSGSDLSDCDLIGTNFSESDLSAVNFSGSIIKNADFSSANLLGAKFINANLLNSDFADADMSGADFTEADLTDAELSCSINLSETIYNKYTVWPDAERLPEDFDADYEEDLATMNEEEDSFGDASIY